MNNLEQAASLVAEAIELIDPVQQFEIFRALDVVWRLIDEESHK